jgi:hypothetical protein
MSGYKDLSNPAFYALAAPQLEKGKKGSLDLASERRGA